MQTGLAVYLAALAFDFVNATLSSSCAAPHTATCYPWGAEGIASSYWTYRSKETYLRSSAVHMAVAAAALLAPLFLRSRLSGIVAMTTILVVGSFALRHFGPALL
jgi:hypothetical protein